LDKVAALGTSYLLNSDICLTVAKKYRTMTTDVKDDRTMSMTESKLKNDSAMK